MKWRIINNEELVPHSSSRNQHGEPAPARTAFVSSDCLSFRFICSSQDVDHVPEAPGLCRRADGGQVGDGSVGYRRDSGEKAGGAGLRQGGEPTGRHTLALRQH